MIYNSICQDEKKNEPRSPRRRQIGKRGSTVYAAALAYTPYSVCSPVGALRKSQAQQSHFFESPNCHQCFLSCFRAAYHSRKCVVQSMGVPPPAQRVLAPQCLHAASDRFIHPLLSERIMRRIAFSGLYQQIDDNAKRYTFNINATNLEN